MTCPAFLYFLETFRVFFRSGNEIDLYADSFVSVVAVVDVGFIRVANHRRHLAPVAVIVAGTMCRACNNCKVNRRLDYR